MNLVATFPEGMTNITVNGLHQWDYGQMLQINDPSLHALVEVHFACAGMDATIVRVCSMINGEGTVLIPDKCLEQVTPVYAWIYSIDGTTGTTVKTITMPIIQRARPPLSRETPADASTKYEEAITEMNALVDAVKSGEMKLDKATEADFAARALNADTAEHATTADSATMATSAESAKSAESATTADSAKVSEGAPNKGENILDGDELGQSFTFANTNGFGTSDKKAGHFKLWRIQRGDGFWTALVPSKNGKMDLGLSDRRYRQIHADSIHIGGKETFSYPVESTGKVITTGQGYYCIQVHNPNLNGGTTYSSLVFWNGMTETRCAIGSNSNSVNYELVISSGGALDCVAGGSSLSNVFTFHVAKIWG